MYVFCIIWHRKLEHELYIFITTNTKTITITNTFYKYTYCALRVSDGLAVLKYISTGRLKLPYPFSNTRYGGAFNTVGEWKMGQGMIELHLHVQYNEIVTFNYFIRLYITLIQ